MSAPISKMVLSRQKELIRSCMAQGVGIEFLDDNAPAFRYAPPPETVGDREAKAERAKPSKRPVVRYRCKRPACICHKSKWYRHRGLEAPADYFVPMAGDDAALTKARKAYHLGDPTALRVYLAKSAPERATAWAAIDAARAAIDAARAEPSLPVPLPRSKAVSMTNREFASIMAQLELDPAGMAKLLGVGWRTCYRYETGDTPVPETVAKLARLLAAQRSGKGSAALQALAAGTL